MRLWMFDQLNSKRTQFLIGRSFNQLMLFSEVLLNELENKWCSG